MRGLRGLLLLLRSSRPAPPRRRRAIVASPGPDRVAVTIYRVPAGGAGAPNLSWLERLSR